ncbi:BACON domain-containing carbohydrate-binding protein [Aureispira sp. CCB-QB1]|uniref:BACON domain-containing protein n=1 Tax=Aureispira sp. CCB-QB1 TaxID=1313421 RepID=UPI00069778DA|nr:BACON domain-containing carbohydrate-binding protein [Aureispira sp. CCB-QB1]
MNLFKSLCFLTLITLGLNQLNAQTYSSIPNLNTFTNCSGSTLNCSGLSWAHGIIRVKVISLTASQIIFRMEKCDGTTFSSNGTMYVKDGSVCGPVLGGSINYTAGYSYRNKTIYHGLSSGQSKTYYITITSSSGGRYYAQPVTVNVSANNTLTVSPMSLNKSASSSTSPITISSNTSWSVSSSASWITTNVTSGSNNGNVYVSLSANTSTSSRTGNVTISSSGISRTVNISQAGQNANLTVSPMSLNKSASSSTSPITISSNTSWSVSSSASWITTNVTSGSNNGNVYVSLSANTSTSSRTGNVTISSSGISRTVNISQAGQNANLTVSPMNLTVNGNETTTTFDIISNSSWNISDNQAWMTTNPTSGTGNATITLNFPPNTSNTDKLATIFVSGFGNNNETINFTQLQQVQLVGYPPILSAKAIVDQTPLNFGASFTGGGNPIVYIDFISPENNFFSEAMNNVSGNSYGKSMQLNEIGDYSYKYRAVINNQTIYSSDFSITIFPDCNSSSQNTYPNGSYNGTECTEATVGQDGWGMVKYNCTSWVAYRVNDYLNRDLHSGMYHISGTPVGTNTDCSPSSSTEKLRNACRWDDIFRANGVRVDTIPANGSIAHWEPGDDGAGPGEGNPVGSAGHVGFVECVDGNQIRISNYNLYPNLCNYSLIVADLSKPRSYSNKLPTQYIHIEENVSGGAGGGTISIDKYQGENKSLNTIYPNPSDGIVYFKNKISVDSKIKVLDVLGKIISLTDGDTDFLDISFLKSGTYFIQIIRKNDLNTYKIVISK